MARFPLKAVWTVVLCAGLHLFGPAASGQFKELGPAPFSPAVARQRIRTLLNQVDPGNRQKTIDQLNSLVPWYRNIVDEELISGWQKDSRDRLTLLMEPMADPHLAAEVVAYSWRTRTDASLNPAYAPLLSHLIARYPESGKQFQSDLLGPTPPRLSPAGEETVCRILLDMPDIGNWQQSARQILPNYRETAERLLRQDRQGGDDDKRYRAEMWLAQLRGERQGAADQPPVIRRRAVVSSSTDDNSGPLLRPAPGTTSPGPGAENRPAPPPAAPATPAPSLIRRPAVEEAYNGPTSGTLECTGSPVPQNAEYVFRNLPPVKLQLDYDRRVWEARLAPGENQSQRLILKNTSSGPQKRCTVHWKVVP